MRLIIFILLCLSLSGCGVIFGGSMYNASIVVRNNPDALIYVNGNKLGKGAAIRSFQRNRPLTVELRDQNCEAQVKTFYNRFRVGNFILSAFTFGLLGMAVDFASGACYQPDYLHDPMVIRETFKTYTFTIDYDGCPRKNYY
jgi:hypothetical protein